MTPTKTFLAAEQGQALAEAVLCVASAVEANDFAKERTRLVERARGLAHAIAFPPSPAPAPSCDAPHCACVDGTDCPTVGTAKSAWTLTRVDGTRIGAVLRLSDGHEVIEFGIPEATSYEDMIGGLHVLSEKLHDDRQTAPPAPDLAARLDGLKASVDALAERLSGRAGPNVIRLEVSHTEVMLNGRTTWVLDGGSEGAVHYPFKAGQLVLNVNKPEQVWLILKVEKPTGLSQRFLRLVVKPAKEG